MHRLILIFVITALAPFPRVYGQQSTWQIIQDRILTPNCTSCHVAGSSFASQSDLILTSDVAYSQLIEVTPKNAAAAEDQLVRVSTEKLAGLYKSFLWEKINAPEQEHFYSDHPFYGAIMPLGADPLTYGELELIRQWIVAGAPQNGQVVDPVVLADTARFRLPEFAPLSTPARGYQVHQEPFDVPPNEDREIFKYLPLNNSEDIYVERVEFVMRPGSHHFILYDFVDNTPASIIPPAGVVRDLRDKNGNYITSALLTMGYHQFVSGTQWPLLSYHFPPGVALHLPANTGLDLNAHYANRTSQTIQGEIYANLHTVDPVEVEHIAEILNLGNTNISLPPHQVTTLTRSFTFSERRYIFQLFSHAHATMQEFKVEIVGGPRDGELIYFADDWEHPPILQIDPPLVLDRSQGLKLEVTYNNTTDHEIKFGLLSTDEMMILFGYYYTDGTTAITGATAPATPADFMLEQNYPNPFNPSTTLRYRLARAAEISLGIYDRTGRLVTTVYRGQQNAGNFTVVWDSGNEPSGVYFAKLQAGAMVAVRKMVLLR